jgi:hypothetical protein
VLLFRLPENVEQNLLKDEETRNETVKKMAIDMHEGFLRHIEDAYESEVSSDTGKQQQPQQHGQQHRQQDQDTNESKEPKR